MTNSLTLSIDDIRQLIEITDHDHCRQVIQSLTDNTANPPAEIDTENYSESHPMLCGSHKKSNVKPTQQPAAVTDPTSLQRPPHSQTVTIL